MRRRAFNTPPVVMNLIIANAIFWLAWVLAIKLQNPNLAIILDRLALYPVGSPHFHSWQIVTYMFMHGSWEHIIFNMFTLWMFGRFIEYDLGSRRFLTYYMVCGIGAGLIQLLVNYLTHGTYPTVGASGAIFGLLLAFGMMHPNDIIMPLLPPIPMKAKWAVLIFIGIELFLGIRNYDSIADNVAHFAHLGGMLWGFMLLWWWKKRGKIYY